MKDQDEVSDEIVETNLHLEEINRGVSQLQLQLQL